MSHFVKLYKEGSLGMPGRGKVTGYRWQGHVLQVQHDKGAFEDHAGPWVVNGDMQIDHPFVDISNIAF
jgi:hypothetical protein